MSLPFQQAPRSCCAGVAVAEVPVLWLSTSLTWQLVRYATSKALLRFPESGAIVVGPSNLCFNKALG